MSFVVETGSVFSPELGFHLHVTLRDGALTQVWIRKDAAPVTDEAVRPLLARLAQHMRDGRDAFADVPVDLSALAPFHRAVLERVREVGPGSTIGYGELAKLMGSPGASRAVGGAMARNPCPIVVPCHRVLPSDGTPGNYSGEGGWATKMRLLEIEGARPKQARLF